MDNFSQIARDASSTIDALIKLHDAGASPVQAIRALHIGRNQSLSDAKSNLMASEAWLKEAAVAEQFHDQLLEILDDETDS